MFEYQLFQPSFPPACAFDYFLLERESRTPGLGKYCLHFVFDCAHNHVDNEIPRVD